MILFASLIAICQATVLTFCEFSIKGRDYRCTIRNLTFTNETEEVLIGRYHTPGKEDADVKNLVFEGSRLVQIPREFCTTFINLDYIDARSSNIRSIESLATCKNLKHFYLQSNQIKKISMNLFRNFIVHNLFLDNNPIERIEGSFYNIATFSVVSFANCKINAIDPKIFEGFDKRIEILNFKNNSCLNITFENVNSKMVPGILPFFYYCFNNFAPTEIPPTEVPTTVKPPDFSEMNCTEDLSKSFYNCETKVSKVNVILYKEQEENQGYVQIKQNKNKNL